MIPCWCAASRAFSDLLGDRQGLVELNRPTRDAPREILAVDEFHDEGADVAGVIQRRQRLRFAREARQAIGIAGKGVR